MLYANGTKSQPKIVKNDPTKAAEAMHKETKAMVLIFRLVGSVTTIDIPEMHTSEMQTILIDI